MDKQEKLTHGSEEQAYTFNIVQHILREKKTKGHTISKGIRKEPSMKTLFAKENIMYRTENYYPVVLNANCQVSDGSYINQQQHSAFRFHTDWPAFVFCYYIYNI